jgi:hypothetical protein
MNAVVDDTLRLSLSVSTWTRKGETTSHLERKKRVKMSHGGLPDGVLIHDGDGIGLSVREQGADQHSWGG